MKALPLPWRTWLHVVLAAGTLFVVGALTIIGARRGRRRFATVALGIGLIALLVLPASWALSHVLVPALGTTRS